MILMIYLLSLFLTTRFYNNGMIGSYGQMTNSQVG